MLRIRFLAAIANVLGVQFKIDGLPYGASYERSMWMQHRTDACVSGEEYKVGGTD